MKQAFAFLAFCAISGIVYAKSVKDDDDDQELMRKKRLSKGVIDAAIMAGSSVASVSIDGLIGSPGVPISLAIVIENWTKWPLTDPKVEIVHGHVSVPPRVVLPGREEVTVAHKQGHVAHGTSGVLSYNIGNFDKRFHVAWMIPYNHNKWANVLALSLSYKSLKYTFDVMYHGSTKKNTMVRAKFWDDIKPLTLTNMGITVEGILMSSYMGKAYIIVKPTRKSDLAPRFQKAIPERL